MAQDSSPTRIGVLRSIAELEQLRPYLTNTTAQRNADLDFFLFSSKGQPGFVRPHVLVSYDAKDPKAILFGRLEKRRLDVGLKYLTSRLPEISTLTFIEGGRIGTLSTPVADLFIRSIIDSLRVGEASVARLEGVEIDTSLYTGARSLPAVFSKDFFPTREVRLARRVEGGQGSVASGLSKNQRDWQKRREKK